MFRKFLKPFPFVLLALITVLPAGAFDPLWKKALAHAAPDDTEVLVGMRMNAIQYNRNGEITKTTVIEMAVDESTGEFVIVSAVEDGRDITEKQRRQAERRSGDESESEYIHGIFDPAKASGLTLEPAGYEVVVHGRSCAAYSFRLEDERRMGPGSPKRVVEEGSVFLDVETGMPLRIQSRMVEGPKSITAMTYTMNAFSGPDGTWRPDYVNMEFAGRMVVYMAGDFRMSFIYSDM